MPMKLSITLGHINAIPNSVNAEVVREFFQYLNDIGTSENYQNQNLKQIIGFAKFLGSEIVFHDVNKKEEIICFLETKKRD